VEIVDPVVPTMVATSCQEQAPPSKDALRALSPQGYDGREAHLVEAKMGVVRRRRSLRLFGSFRGWTKDYLGRDILAGLTLAAITVPEQMATAKLGGFEPQIGFYAFIGATIGFAALGASRVLTAGADSTITPIFAGAVAALAAGGSTSIGSVATTLAFLVGVLLIAGGILKLGWIANLLSTPVVTGFLAGIAVNIVVSQLPSLFGIAKGGGDLVGQALAITSHLSKLNPFATAIGLGVLAITLLAERISAHPGALIGIALATLAVLAFDLESRGVAVLGAGRTASACATDIRPSAATHTVGGDHHAGGHDADSNGNVFLPEFVRTRA
jgi:MFS superfamily sulfate permease-like transporter